MRVVQHSAHRFSVAPMMDWTDRHCRAFHRCLTRKALLFTEMVTSAAVVHGERDRLIGFADCEHPVALQLGGSEPAELARASRIGADFGYDEINLNCGCPSDRVQSGRFGAALMAEPERVARCVAAMQAATDVPVTVKCRIGIDDQDSERDLDRFVSVVADAGCRRFTIHARKAWLSGLSPKENRDIPPLDYGRVYRLKARRPELEIVLNGGIVSLDAALAHVDKPEEKSACLDGVMLGRAAYQTPWLLAGVDREFFGAAGAPSDRFEALERFFPHVEAELAAGTRLHGMTRHVLGLFQGLPGARRFRQILSTHASRNDAGLDVLVDAMTAVREATARADTAASPSVFERA
ncbi:MAG: tRNA dihydrouridine(20/20a) synthase DusA [Pseudomonadota bacterium]